MEPINLRTSQASNQPTIRDQARDPQTDPIDYPPPPPPHRPLPLFWRFELFWLDGIGPHWTVIGLVWFGLALLFFFVLSGKVGQKRSRPQGGGAICDGRALPGFSIPNIGKVRPSIASKNLYTVRTRYRVYFVVFVGFILPKTFN